jgi:hypothetical protein
MRTAAKPKSGKNDSKKRFTAENRVIGLTNIAEAGSSAPGGIFEEAVAAEPSIKGISIEEKIQLIAETAYFRSEKRSFAPGYELEDWLAAEAEIETKLSGINSPIRSQCHANTRPGRR